MSDHCHFATWFQVSDDTALTRTAILRMRQGAKPVSEITESKLSNWPELQRFDVLDLPEFPTHVLPAPLQAFVAELSHATQTPADLAGLLSLAVCSASIAKRVYVKPKQGWLEPSNLFISVLLEPGNRKTAVFDEATEPLKEIENELITEAQPKIAQWKADRKLKEARLKKLTRDSAECSDLQKRLQAGSEANQLALELEQYSEPNLPRLIVSDCSTEKLAIFLAENKGRLASFSDEGEVFDIMAGRYSKDKNPNFDVYLKGHSGSDIVQDRVSRSTIRITKATLTCAYAVQPSVIQGLASNPVFRGRGLLARFLYAIPLSWIGYREVDATPVSTHAREEYRQTIRRLACDKSEAILTLDKHAGDVFTEWRREIERDLRDGGAMELMRDWGGKLAGASARIAAILHCIELEKAKEINEATISAAITIARYLIPHAEAVLNLMQASDNARADDAQYLLRWIKKEQHKHFSKRDAHRYGQKRFPKSDDLNPALEELARRGYIRQTADTDTDRSGRKPSPRYEVNPAVFDSLKTVDRIDKTDTGTPETSNSVNSVNHSEQSKKRKRVTI